MTCLLLLLWTALGLCVGSFCNVLIFRLPLGEEFVKTPSHCMACGHRLRWYELIPVASWLMQGGKCRACGEKLSAQYPVVEALNGGAWLLAAWLYQGDVLRAVLYSLLFSIPVGIGLGIFAAIKKNKWQDSFISTMVMLFVSIPSYVYAFLVQYFLYFKLGWLPLQVYSLADAGGSWMTWKMFYSMIAPILALSFGEIAGLCRFTRAELTETLTSDYMLLARTKGLSRAQATVRHAMKNAMVPILPMLISSFIGILGGSMIIEQIFSIPGVGQLYIKSIRLFDYDVFMMDGIFYTFIGLLAGIVVDISYGFIDPRIRMGAR